MTRYLLLLFAMSLFWTATGSAAAPGEISLYLFQQGNPKPDVQVQVGEDRTDTTNRNGAINQELPPGTYPLVLREGETVLAELEISISENENKVLILTLRDGAPPELYVESSHEGAARQGTARAATERPQGEPGLLRGRIDSSEDDSPIANARVFVAGTPLEATTNEDGVFEMEVPSGTYTLSVVHPDYSTQTVDDVKVVPKTAVQQDIALTPAGLQLETFTVLAPYIEGSVAATVASQRADEAVTEVIGADEMSRAGDSDAAAALKRVTGLTLSGGKFVNIRGQPARYTQTTWNGSPLPSPDPIKRVVPLDLFPTGLLSSVQVQKSFTADQPGSFGAGLVKLNTKGVPDQGFLAISTGAGFNTQSTFEEGLDHDGGGRDWLGIDDGTRALPGEVEAGIDDLVSIETRLDRELVDTLPNNYEITDKTLPPDRSVGLSGGRKFDWLGGSIGFLGSVSWSQKWRLQEETDRDFRGAALSLGKELDEIRTDMDVSLGTLFVMSGEWDRHRVTSNTFFIQDTTKRSEVSEGISAISDDRVERNFLLEWNERRLIIQQLLGSHDVIDGLAFDWRYLTAFGDRESPDRREYRYIQNAEGEFRFDEESATRRYNTVDDSVDSWGGDLTFNVLDRDAAQLELKSGYSQSSQERESETEILRLIPAANVDLLQQNPEAILEPGNVERLENLTQGSDSYDGTADVSGYYLSADTTLWQRVRLIAGARQEDAEFDVTTFRADGTVIESGFDTSNTLRSIAVTGFLTDSMQLRTAFGETISRPLLVELSDTAYFDPDSVERFRGNPELQPTEIDSLDVRWEWYPSKTESLTFAWFRKDYTNAIEQIIVPLAGGGEENAIENAPEAEVTGYELGARFGLDWAASEGWFRGWLQNSYVQGNFTLMDSEVDLGEDAGQATNDRRRLQGQAETVLNLQLGYDGERYDWSVLFNRVGERLDRAGTSGEPDIFQEPVGDLDFVWGYQPAERWKWKFKAQNLLDPDIQFRQGNKIERSLTKGIDFGLSVEYGL